MENDIITLVFDAQGNPNKLNKLIDDFLPFIKRCVAQSRTTPQSREDALTLTMLAFADSVRAYKLEKGAFIPFAQTIIRNRLIDDFRVEQKHVTHNVPLLEDGEGNADWDISLSCNEYSYQLEQTSLRLEIEEVTGMLASYGTTFAELAKICPKQKRTRAQCEYAATLLMKNEVWRKQLFEKRRLPNKEMCEIYGVSAKILEKYKKYIATLCIIQSGDYPMLRAFLPSSRKEGMGDE